VDIGVFGGTFDPVHLGHLIVAEDVRKKLNLSKVLFIPVGEPWLKHGTVIAAAHRAEMVRRAIASNPHFELSTMEVDRPGPTYTVDTMSALQHLVGARANLFFIIGADALVQLPEWREPERLIRICRLVAMTRPGSIALDLEQLEESIPGVSPRIAMVKVREIDISSTDIRERVGQGLSIRHLVPEAVERYIMEQGLYARR